MKNKINFKIILKQKEYRKLLCANIINRFGDSIDAIALTWLIYQISSSASLSALNFGLNFVPSALFTPFAGAFVEKRNKKMIMVLTDLGRGILVSLIAFLTLTQKLEPYMLLIFTFLISTLEAFRQPCGSSVVTTLISKDMYAHATSLSNSLSQVTELIGTAAAGVIIGLIGIGWAIFIDALTFFLSALIIFCIHMPKIQKTADHPPVLHQFKEGMRYIQKHSTILINCIIASVMNICLVPFNSLQSALVSDLYGMGSEVLSIIGVSLSIGMISGSLVYPKFTEKMKTSVLMFISFIMISLFLAFCIIIIPIKDIPFLFFGSIIIFCFLFGFFLAMMSAANSVALLKMIDQDYMARVMSIFNAVAICSIPIGSFIVSFLTSFLRIEIIFIGTSLLSCGFTIFMKTKKIFDRIDVGSEQL